VRQELAWLYEQHPELLDDPDVARTIEPQVIQAVKDSTRGKQPGDRNREEFARAMRNTRRMQVAGVLIGVGSDGGSAIDFPGSMTLRELDLLVEAACPRCKSLRRPPATARWLCASWTSWVPSRRESAPTSCC